MKVFFFTAFSRELPASSVDPDQMLQIAASELGLHCLHNTPKQVCGLKRIDMSDKHLPEGLSHFLACK